MNYILKNWVLLLLTLSLVAIVSALSAEFIFDMAPCKMCLKQRHPYYVIIILTLLFYYFKMIRNIWLFVFTQLAILYGLFYSIWHVGIEKKILSGPVSCSGKLLNTKSIQNLKEQISNQPIINCNDIIWTILGLSAATVNCIILLLFLIFNSIYIKKAFYDSKKIY